MNIPISYQPTAKSRMFLSGDPSQNEKSPQTTGCGDHDGHSHQHECTRRKLRIASIMSLVLAALGVLTFIFLCYLDVAGDEIGGSMSFLKRAIGSGNSNNGTTGDETPFVRNKYWIIVLVLGLVVCIILGVMLSAWCCKGAFENPLCCPCYLCACCGGLACLECISCGICADLANQ